MTTALMRSAQRAAKVVAGWSAAKQDYAKRIMNSDGGVESRNTRSVSLADGSQSSGSTLGLADLAGVAPGPSDPDSPAALRERIAELQYEAGMYHSLYENMKNLCVQLEAKLAISSGDRNNDR